MGRKPWSCLCLDHGVPPAPRTRQVSPPGLGETSFFSERDLIVAIDQLGVLTLGRLWAAQEIDLLGDDLAAVAVVPRAVGLDLRRFRSGLLRAILAIKEAGYGSNTRATSSSVMRFALRKRAA